MDEKPRKYILLTDKIGQHIEKGLSPLSTKNIPTQFIRGELLEALLEVDQPQDHEKIALTSLTNKQQRVECSTSEVSELTDNEAELLMAVFSAEERLRNFQDRNRLDFIKLLTVGSKVMVTLKNIPSDSRGVIWYIGPLPTYDGTMFGVELLSKEALGQGTTDGTFGNRQYFICPQNCGVFIAMDKIRPFEELPRSPKKDTPNFKSKLSSIKVRISSGFKSKSQERPLPVLNYIKLKIDQRVIVYVKEKPVLGHVRYIADTLDDYGGFPVGIELDERLGSGTGKFQGLQRFVCKNDYALFVSSSVVIPEEDFYDSNEGQDKLVVHATSNTADNHSIEARLEGTVVSTSDGHVQHHLSSEMQTDVVMDAVPNIQDSNAELKDDEDKKRLVARRLGLELGSMVEVPLMNNNKKQYGVIRWIGELPELRGRLVAGLELEEDQAACSDGVFNGVRYFTCPPRRAFFVNLPSCRRDSRFQPESPVDVSKYFVADQTHDSVKVDESKCRLNNQTQNQHATCQQALQEVRSQLAAHQHTAQAAQNQLTVEREAHLQTQSQLAAHQHTAQETQNQLTQEKEAHLQTQSQLAAHQHTAQEAQNQLATYQQAVEDAHIRLAEEKKAHLQTYSQLAAHQHTVQEVHNQLAAYQMTAQNAQNQLAEEQEAHLQTQSQLAAHQHTVQETQNQLTEEQEAHLQTHSQLDALREVLEDTRNDFSEAESTISSLRQALEESRNAKEKCDWVLTRNDIQISEREIGRGAWGRVVEGRFCGTVVAVKQIHDVILSPHNQRLFEREMNIASRCRHPCLLQFIGATNDEGSPLFVTELLDTSLRAVLQERALEPDEITTIARDVARALNYLHLGRPAPIIHRDISSANVLLWKHGERWNAKVSDYGTANFMQYSMTVNPGAQVYSAPEAQNSRQQSPKVDVYSYGVLLCEMNIRELPDPQRRDEQVAMVSNRILRALIRRCLEDDPENRPSMDEIIHTLERD